MNAFVFIQNWLRMKTKAILTFESSKNVTLLEPETFLWHKHA